jgi:hypothetical protein
MPVIPPKPITWSYSSLSKFETCPYQWYAQYILKEIKFIPNAAVLWGQQAHDELDIRLKTGKPMPNRFERYEKYALAVEKYVKKVDGRLETEYEMAIDEDYNQVGWWDKSAVQRGKSDVSILYDNKCLIEDWKTGKYRPNTQELEYFSFLTFIIHPEVEDVRTIYLWFKEDGPPTIDQFNRAEDFDRLEETFQDKIYSIEQALEMDLFPAKRSGLCRNYCGSTTCKHSGSYVGS